MRDYWDQIKKIWKELGFNQRVSIALAGAFFCMGIIALGIWSSRPNMQLLYAHLDSADMGEIVQHLDDEKIPYELRAGGSTIFVPSNKVYAIRIELAGKGIPTGGSVGYEIFDRTNFGISDFVQRTNYIRAIQGELARTIMQVKGVRNARVMIVVPENKLLVDKALSKSTASVFVDTGGALLNEGSVNSIRFLVANAVDGLSVKDVAVVDNHGTVLSENLAGDPAFGMASSQMRYRESIEQYYTGKIESLLGKVLGVGNVVARVAVDVDLESSTLIEERYNPDGQVIRNQSVTEDISRSSETKPTQGGGLAPNPSNAGESDSSVNSSSSEESRKNKTTAYEISKSTYEVVKSPGTLKRISAAVFIAMRFQGEGNSRAPVPRTNEEMDMLNMMVSNAIGVAFNGRVAEDRQVTLKEIPFESLEKETLPSFISIPEPIFKWIDLGRNFIALVVALILFIIFWRMLKKSVPQQGSMSLLLDDREERQSAINVTPGVTPEMLNDLIKQKPENVSTALKEWVVDEAEEAL